MLHRITGRAKKCGPSAISAIAGLPRTRSGGVPTHEAAAVIRRLTGRRAVNGVYMDELAAALAEFGWTPDYALRHYCHAQGSGKAIRAYAPKDGELHRIADALQDIQRRNIWQLHASIRHRGRHFHECTMAVEVERDSPVRQPPTDGAEDAVTGALRDLARWLYRRLREEYEHETSDEAVDEALSANGVTFTAEGRRFG